MTSLFPIRKSAPKPPLTGKRNKGGISNLFPERRKSRVAK